MIKLNFLKYVLMVVLIDVKCSVFQVTGKAVMLDEIINYVQSLQRQVEVIILIRSIIVLTPNFDQSVVFNLVILLLSSVSVYEIGYCES